MKTKVAFGLVLSFLVLAIFGCGGGDGGGGGGATTTPVLMTVTQSAITANTNTINTSVTITAHATVNGIAVPDGALVAFTVKSGAGTLSAPSVATVNGDASVTLTSTTDGTSVVVTASNGGASADSAAITFTDPNRLTQVLVSASPTTGIVPGTVAISASAIRLGGNGIIAGSPMPDGTTVSFAVTSGTGTLSAASAPMTGGHATVNLSSTATNTSVTVMAAAGSLSNTVTVPFITQPTQAIVKVQTSGTLPANMQIGNISATVTYSTNKGLSITAGNVVASGVGVALIFAADVSTPGQVGLSLTLNPTTRAVIAAGEFATLTFGVAPGFIPTASDFGIASFSVLNDGNEIIPGMAVTIMSVTVQ